MPTVDPTRLAPEDAYLDRSTVRSSRAGAAARSASESRISHGELRKRSRGKHRKTTWKKLLWVKQPYPDNYTDEETFLDALQRNPRLIPYEFWPLVADSTVIVQQVCTVVIFSCCFAAIFQDRASPVSVVRWSTGGTVLGWLLWDLWTGRMQAASSNGLHDRGPPNGHGTTTASKTKDSHDEPAVGERNVPGVMGKNKEINEWTTISRNEQRLATIKSAVLIYCVLLGLSPVLKSLTESTSSDSIWAISFWLLCINVIFFDYGRGEVGTTFPASLSTNAALMASTVLASRLPTTTHVFSLTLFSIEVFGLFPVFRRYLRRISRWGHFALTWLLVMGAGGGVAVSFTGRGWLAAAVGSILGCVLTGLAMGLCSVWLIGLQRYKNEIRGPWDAARPVIRRFD